MSKRQNTGQGYLFGDEPGVDLTEVETEIDAIKNGFDSLNAQYQATASKYTQNGIIFPDNTQQTTAATGVPFTSSFIAQTGSNEEGKGLLSIGNTNAQAAANRSPPTCKNSTFIGEGAGDGIEVTSATYGGDNATAVGYKAMGDLESGRHMTNTTAVGTLAGYQTRSIHTTMVGYEAGSGCDNQASVFVGVQCGKNTTKTTGFNVGVGAYACQGSNQSNAVAIGYKASQGGNGNKGHNNVMIGHEAGQNTSENGHVGRNTFIGKSAGQNAWALRCIYIGHNAGKDTGVNNGNVNSGFKLGTLLSGTLPNYAGGTETGVFKIHANHVEVDPTNFPTSYDSTTYPNRIWHADGVLMIGNNTAPTPVPHTQSGNQTSIYIGKEANHNSTSSGNYTTAVGYRANSFVTSGGGQWNACFGAQAGMYYMGQMNTFIGYATGGGGSSSSGGQKVGSHNVFVGHQAGMSSGGNRNIFIGSEVTGGSGDDRFKLGCSSQLLFDGKLPTSSTEGELLINATKLKVNSSIKTQADLASLDVGQIYVDTSAGNVLKMKT